MKQKLLNKLWLRVGMIVAIMTTALSGTAWADTAAGTFEINFYDSSKLSSTSGTGLTNSNYSSFVAVPTGVTSTDVVTSVSVTGTVQYGKNGGLTAGTGTAASADSHYVTFNIGQNYAVTKCTVYATAYESGRWLLNGNAADEGSLGSKGATIDKVTTPLVWDNLGGVTALTFKKDNGSGGNQKRLTIYKIVCEYSTGGSTLTTSDLALTGAPVALNFDLYNNASAQTVIYTSSSTGAVTVSKSDYVETSVSGNTITVTPVKVTPSAQTITVSQEADATYAAGSKMFTVNITDSTPFAITDGEFDFTVGEDYGSLCPNGSSSSISDQDEYTWTAGNVTLKTAGRHIWENKKCLKLYKSTTTQPTAGYIEVSVPSGYNITKIEFTMGDKNYLTGDGLNNAKTEWTGESRSVTISTGTDRSDIEKVIVTYEAASPLASIALSGTYQTTFSAGDTFNHDGVVVTATYEDSSTLNVTSEATFSTPDMTTAGSKTITVSYTESGVTKTASYTINVQQAANTSVTISGTLTYGEYTGTDIEAGQLTATVTNTDANTTIVGATVTWESDNTAVATVDVSGNVTIKGVGTANITASYAGEEGTYKPSTSDARVVTVTKGVVTKTLPYNETFASSIGFFETEVITAASSDIWTNDATHGYMKATSYLSGSNQNAEARLVSPLIDLTGIAADANVILTFDQCINKYFGTVADEAMFDIREQGGEWIKQTIIYPSVDSGNWSSFETQTINLNSYKGKKIQVSFHYVGTSTAAGTWEVKNFNVEAIAKSDPIIVVNATETVAYGSTFTVDDSVIEGGDITVTSSNTAVATVDGLVITPVAVGTVTITVETAENVSYNEGSATFELTVTAPEGKTTAAPSTSTIFSETFAGCAGTGGNDDSWSGSIASNTLNADNTGWTFSNGSGASACAKFGSGSKKGSATTPALGAAGTLSLSFRAGAWDGGSEGTTLKLSVSEGNISETSVTLTKGEFNTYTATITNATAATTITFEAQNASNNRFFLDDIVVTQEGETITATLNASGYATFCSQYPLDFSDYETADYSAWQITGVSGETITFSQIKGSIKGGQGILLKGTAGETVELTSVNSSTTLSGNLLEGTLAPKYVAADEYYGLSGKTFVKVKAGTVPAGKALLPASALGSNVKAFTFVFEEDDATAIEMVNGQSSMVNGPIYNLAGQRISKMQKGINIVNGKKILK